MIIGFFGALLYDIFGFPYTIENNYLIYLNNLAVC